MIAYTRSAQSFDTLTMFNLAHAMSIYFRKFTNNNKRKQKWPR